MSREGKKLTETTQRNKRRRRRQIYKLGEFRTMGFSLANASPGDEVLVRTKAAVLSDSPTFHHYMRSFAQEVDAKLSGQDVPLRLSQASNFLVVVDPDFTATIYIDCVEYSLQVVSKRAVEKGEAVWLNDIGDIYRGTIIFPKIRDEQRFILCLRHQWKFMLIFDLTPEQRIDLESLDIAIGFGMRRLLFEQLYQIVADEGVLAAIISKGWFPFNELIGVEFDNLQQSIVNDFDIETVEAGLVAKFTPERLALLMERWWRNPQYVVRQDLLAEGVRLFSEGRYISSIKTLITEIEGILRERHVPRTPGRQGMDKVLSVAFEGISKIAGDDTIYFPQQFVGYLNSSFFSHFDPEQPATKATRNTVGHGRAPCEVYTSVRALQTVLVLDQINRYITLPSRPNNNT